MVSQEVPSCHNEEEGRRKGRHKYAAPNPLDRIEKIDHRTIRPEK
jgi:hypothetical protein